MPGDASCKVIDGSPANRDGRTIAPGVQPGTAQSFGYARLYLIVREGNRWVGAADPRHDGQVRGY